MKSRQDGLDIRRRAETERDGGIAAAYALGRDAIWTRANCTSLGDSREGSGAETIAAMLRTTMTGVNNRLQGKPHHPTTDVKARLPT